MEAIELAEAADKLKGKEPDEIVHWAVDTFGDKLAVGTSLGAEAMVIMDLVATHAPETKFLFLDTDFHFQDTLDLLEKAKKRFNIKLDVVKTNVSPAQQAKQYGDQLYFKDPATCCDIRKVQPMRQALKGFEAWFTGMRRDQTLVRASLPHVTWDDKFGLLKISPILDWTSDEVWEYIRKHDLPYNRLHDMGYPSIGCGPCTRPVKPGEDPRAGRWAGFDKSECGLHGGK